MKRELLQGFPYWEMMGVGHGGVPPPAENFLIPDHLEKFPVDSHPQQTFIPPPPQQGLIRPTNNNFHVITQ